jgi:hypothetical protein
MTTLPLHAVPVLLDDQVRLRVYVGRDLKVDMPLRPRQALVLAGQLLNLALMAETSTAGTDRRVFETPGEQRVTAKKRAHG